MQEVNGVPYPETGDDVQLTSVLSAMASGIAELFGKNTWEWKPINLAPGFTVHSGQNPEYIIRNGVLHMRGAIAGTFSASSYASITLATPELIDISNGWDSAVVLAAAGGRIPLRGYIDNTGTVRVMLVHGGASGELPSYVTLNGFSGLLLRESA